MDDRPAADRRSIIGRMDDPAARVELLTQGLREIREVSSLKRLEASLTDDPAARLKLAGEALQRIDTIVQALLET